MFNIPQYEPLIGYLEKKNVCEYMGNPGFLTEYKKTEEFEIKIAAFLKTKYCIVVNNGTISLSLALLALGIKPGDRVIVPDMTMIATPNAVKLIGAEPIFVDIDDNLLLDFKKAEEVIDVYKVKAVIFVSLNGRSFGSNAWKYIWDWKSRGIKFIDDAAQSFSSKNYEECYIGTRGCDIGSFSFSMPKIITTGQGGCLVTNNDDLAKRLRQLKDFGRSGGGNDIHETFGINSKFTELQAVIGLSQLEDIDFRIRRKKEISKLYRKNLKNISEIKFIEDNFGYTVPWFIDIFIDEPHQLANFLKTCGINTRRIYPPIHKQEAYSSINDWSYPNTEKYASRGLWLPSSLTLTDSNIDFICSKIKEFYV